MSNNEKTKNIAQNLQKNANLNAKNNNLIEQTQRESRQQRRNRERQERKNRAKMKKYKSAVIGLTVAVSILAVTTAGLGIAYGVTQSQANTYGTQLESIYKQNYYDLVDNVNNADMEISKLVNSNDTAYQKKLLLEIADAANSMQNNMSMLPLTGENVLDSVRFVNQLSGYTQTLEEKVANGGTLSDDDVETLKELHETLISMKQNLNRMSENMRDGYSILLSSNEANGDLNSFTVDFNQIKSMDVDYPTMIYDGPFSDSVVNSEVKGLSGNEITKDDAIKEIEEVFKDISSINYEGDTNGKFETYNYSLMTTDSQDLYVQVLKQGGHILTVSGQNFSDIKNIDMENGGKIALDFAKRNGIEKAKIVWQEELNNQAYFNIAPIVDNVIIYPELVKVKVDMEYGNVIGYDAITYFTNHTSRELGGAGDLEVTLPSGFTLKEKRLVLAPLDYNREVLCYEYEAEKEGITYYFYFNAKTGKEENILKVVETNDSSKLM